MANLADDSRLPDNLELASKVLDAKIRERGVLGKLFGTREHAPTNIVALALIIIAILFVLTLFLPAQGDVNKGTFLTALISAFTFALGLIFGRKVD